MRLMTEVQRKLDPTKDRIPDAIAASKDGLAPECRAQDKAIQFLIRMLLVDYRTSILRRICSIATGQKALADAEAGLTLVKTAKLSTSDEAQAHGAKGIAYAVIYGATTKVEDKQRSKAELTEAVRIDADNPASWKWKSYLAVYLGQRKGDGAGQRRASGIGSHPPRHRISPVPGSRSHVGGEATVGRVDHRGTRLLDLNWQATGELRRSRFPTMGKPKRSTEGPS